MSTDLGLLVLRLGYGGLLIWFHGWARFLRAYNYFVHDAPWTFVNVVQNLGFPAPGIFATASVLSESVGALLLMAGFFSRTAATILVINFSVATISEAAKGDPWELPGLYLLGAVALLLTGPGRFSVDGTRRGSRPKARRG